MRRYAAGRLLTAGVLLTMAAALVEGQQAKPSPAFDVAAIKENKSGENGGRLGGPPSRFTATNMPVVQFIIYAYDVQGFQIEGAPDWTKKDRFDINARTEGDFPVAPPGGLDPRKPMMRALLGDRFKLAAHIESKQLPIYAIVLAKNDKPLGPQIHSSNTDCAALIAAVNRGQGPTSLPLTPDGNPDCANRWLPGRVTAGTQPMSAVVAVLSNVLQRTVVDRTGLKDNYSFTLTWTPDAVAQSGGPDASAVDPNGPSLFTAIQEQLGLKLESTRGPGTARVEFASTHHRAVGLQRQTALSPGQCRGRSRLDGQ